MGDSEQNSSANSGTSSRFTDSMTNLLNDAASFVSVAIREWLHFLINQPVNPPFSFNAQFADESGRSSRLVVLVVILSAVIVGSNVLLSEGTVLGKFSFATSTVVSVSLGILIGAFLVAIFYKPFASLLQVCVAAEEGKPKGPLSLGQVFYSVLYTFVPWIPVFSLLRLLAFSAEDTALILLILLFWVSVIWVIRNFIATIVTVTRCPWYKAVLSVFIVLMIIVAIVVFGLSPFDPTVKQATQASLVTAINGSI